MLKTGQEGHGGAGSGGVPRLVLGKDDIAGVMARQQGTERSAFSQEVRFVDFEHNGKPFTQAAIVLTPDNPLIVDNRRVVVVASEGGSDNGRGFIRDHAGEEGIGPWLAKRGVTFIALCRLGRWNFLSDDPLGSWADVPLGERMPVFHRGQKRHWPRDEYEVTGVEGVSSHTDSKACRVPLPGSELEAHMMALTPLTSMRGFEVGLKDCLDLSRRDEILLLYTGFSTGGTYMWSFSKTIRPDGVVGYGTSSFPSVYYQAWSRGGDNDWLYDRSVFRLRERGAGDFAFFNYYLAEGGDKEAQWREALHEPRFKSHEDTFMTFNVGAMCEGLTRLWRSSLLPAGTREKGYAALLQDNLDPAFPDHSLAPVAVYDVYGSEDIVLPPQIAQDVADVMSDYCRRYDYVSLQGYHHSISSDHARAFGSLWLNAIEDGFFNVESKSGKP